jgi:hypothetical protein
VACVVRLLVGGGLRVRGFGGGAGDPAGEGVLHAFAGDPAFQLVPVRGYHGQSVAAVDPELAKCLAERFRSEQRQHVMAACGGDG